jgi:hypothetical protein
MRTLLFGCLCMLSFAVSAQQAPESSRFSTMKAGAAPQN